MTKQYSLCFIFLCAAVFFAEADQIKGARMDALQHSAGQSKESQCPACEGLITGIFEQTQQIPKLYEEWGKFIADSGGDETHKKEDFARLEQHKKETNKLLEKAAPGQLHLLNHDQLLMIFGLLRARFSRILERVTAYKKVHRRVKIELSGGDSLVI